MLPVIERSSMSTVFFCILYFFSTYSLKHGGVQALKGLAIPLLLMRLIYIYILVTSIIFLFLSGNVAGNPFPALAAKNRCFSDGGYQSKQVAMNETTTPCVATRSKKSNVVGERLNGSRSSMAWASQCHLRQTRLSCAERKPKKRRHEQKSFRALRVLGWRTAPNLNGNNPSPFRNIWKPLKSLLKFEITILPGRISCRIERLVLSIMLKLHCKSRAFVVLILFKLGRDPNSYQTTFL